MLSSPARTGPTRRASGTGRHTMPPTSVPDYYDDEEPRRNIGKIVAVVAGVVAVLALAGFALSQIFGGPAQPRQVAVPPMANQTELAARNQLINLDLRPTVVNEPSDTVGRGQVVRSDPAEGALVPEGASVTLVVSTGPAEVRIRALAGLTPEDAQAQIVEDGLVVGTVEQRDTTDADLVGRVISSDPAGGVTVAAGATVNLVVGREVTTREVPSVEGQNLDQARQTLASAGFTDVEDEQVDGAGEEGEVLGTTPRAGQRAEPGATITIQVSRGNQVTVPNLDGLDRDAAIQSLREAGFTGEGIREQQRSIDDPNRDGRVIEQSISPGEVFEDGDQLVITYGDANGGGGDDGDN
jgi:serine/threonine-protein kinase